MRKPKILFMPKDKMGCGFYRMLMPANELKKQNLAEVEVTYDPLQRGAFEGADLVVFQRPTSYDIAELMQYLRANGKKIIFEIDDFMQALLPSNPARPFWEHIGGNISRGMHCMRLANAVTVSTPRLQNEYSFYNPKIYVLPNYIDRSLWEQPMQNPEFYEKRKQDDIIRIGWEGCVGHRQDLELVAKVLEDIVLEYKGKVHLCLFGFTPIDIFLKLPNMHQVCGSCGHGGPLEYYPSIPLLQYPTRLRELAFDIGIAPTVEIAFNDCKSDLRFKEHAMLGIPTVASKVPAYQDSVINGHTGFLCRNNYKEWYSALKTLIEDEIKRKEMGKNAKEWAMTKLIENNISKWVKTYDKILHTID